MTGPRIVPATTATAPPAYPCGGCGVTALATLIAYPKDGVAPFPLCRACARDPAHLRALVRRLAPD